MNREENKSSKNQLRTIFPMSYKINPLLPYLYLSSLACCENAWTCCSAMGLKSTWRVATGGAVIQGDITTASCSSFPCLPSSHPADSLSKPGSSVFPSLFFFLLVSEYKLVCVGDSLGSTSPSVLSESKFVADFSLRRPSLVSWFPSVIFLRGTSLPLYTIFLECVWSLNLSSRCWFSSWLGSWLYFSLARQFPWDEEFTSSSSSFTETRAILQLVKCEATAGGASYCRM